MRTEKSNILVHQNQTDNDSIVSDKSHEEGYALDDTFLIDCGEILELNESTDVENYFNPPKDKDGDNNNIDEGSVRQKRMKRKECLSEKLLTSASNTLNTIVENINVNKENLQDNSREKSFCDFLCKRMKLIETKKIKIELEHKILNLLQESEINDLDSDEPI